MGARIWIHFFVCVRADERINGMLSQCQEQSARVLTQQKQMILESKHFLDEVRGQAIKADQKLHQMLDAKEQEFQYKLVPRKNLF